MSDTPSYLPVLPGTVAPLAARRYPPIPDEPSAPTEGFLAAVQLAPDSDTQDGPSDDLTLPSPRPRKWPLAKILILASVVLYVLLTLIVPLGALAIEAFRQGAAALAKGLTTPTAREALVSSLLLTVIAIVVNGGFGVVAALVLVRQRFRGRALLDALVDITFAVSPVMTGLAFLLLFGRTGWFAPLTERLHLQVVFAFPGLVLATLFVTVPFTVREVSYVLAELGTDEEQVAATLGASRLRTFWLVTLPNVRHALIVGVTLTAARALGEFGAVLVLGGAIAGKTHTATTFIYSAAEERQEPAAYGTAILLALISMLLLLTLEHFKDRGNTP
ncbi:MAG: sulfate ABC transporter permease subunit [Gemmatimonadaceae bacterium]